MKEGLKSIALQQQRALWEEAKRFKRKVGKQVEEFKANQRSTVVSRKREIQILFAGKCRVAVNQAEPSEAELQREMLGDPSITTMKIREISKNILARKGTLKVQT
jgi:hypothetical protein